MRRFLQGAQIKRLLLNAALSRLHFNRTKRWENMGEGQKRPLLLGIPLTKLEKAISFCAGRWVYTLNREALRLIGDEGGPLHTLLTDSVDSREDVFIASLLSAVDTYASGTHSIQTKA
jgi:hypothetical protein